MAHPSYGDEIGYGREMKLCGFDHGVTLSGGFSFATCTPAHGSACDIAGKGVADPGATHASRPPARGRDAARRAAPAAAG